jgi:hypothetical protein
MTTGFRILTAAIILAAKMIFPSFTKVYDVKTIWNVSSRCNPSFLHQSCLMCTSADNIFDVPPVKYQHVIQNKR